MRDSEARSVNPSANRELSDIVAGRMSRRTVLAGSAAAAVGFLGASSGGLLAAPGAGADVAHAQSQRGGGGGRRLLGFESVPTNTDDAVMVPSGYVAEVLVPWGTPLSSRGPAWRPDGTNTAADQARQVGSHHDGMHYFPLGRGRSGSERGLLVVNHEYIDDVIHYAGSTAVMTQQMVDKALAAHGVTVIEVAKGRHGWRHVDSRYNRRVTGTTPVQLSGPVGADHPAVQANNPLMGTLNNCAHGFTPWGTYLACEENWNGYFGTTDASFVPTPDEARYGINAGGFGYRWHEADPRFDVAVNRNELNRFGWVVEIDPFDPRSTPVKHTALGRIKHEGALVTESQGRAVVYMGDDQDHEYIYKFVSREPWRTARARRRSPLADGTLYVARFNEDGSGDWLPLVFGTGPLTAANGFPDQAAVALRTRQAADAVGATELDRPEWIARNPRDGSLYATLTNGSSGPDAVNPRNPNPYGHIVRWEERRGDGTATRFSWDVFVLAGDPAYDPEVTIDGDIFGSPDGLWFDADGRLWIQTDVSNSSQNRPERGYDGIGNNQMLAADPTTGEVRRFLVGPRGCEITGVITTPDQETMFVNVQHPGEATTFWGTPTPENPRVVSNWPDFDPAGRPRSATLVIRKSGGGKIGT